MKSVWLLFSLHILAMIFGLIGILVMIPHPALWNGSPALSSIFSWSIAHSGATHILFGAAAMFAMGVYALGWLRTLVFFFIGIMLPAAAELHGTATGWPFGGYAYTDFLGYKLAGRVPYSVPLSWFYMGLASYILGVAIVRHFNIRPAALVSVMIGAYLLMSWDLVLDPAMASPQMPLHFWTWSEHGPYFGMPLRNLLGWFGTGLLFIGVSRLPWHSEPRVERLPIQLPLMLYAANVVWAMSLSLSVGLWPTALAAVLCSLIPASLALGWLPWSVETGASRVGGESAPIVS